MAPGSDVQQALDFVGVEGTIEQLRALDLAIESSHGPLMRVEVTRRQEQVGGQP